MAKKWLVIDSHTHIIPKEAAAKAGFADGFDYAAPLRQEGSVSYAMAQDVEGMLRVMEDSGIDMAVINKAAWSPQGLEMCKLMNDKYVEVGNKYPGKFILCGTVPLQGGQDAADEVERCISELGLKGMSLVSSMLDANMDSPGMWPVYEKIQKLDVPIVVHPTLRMPIWGGGKKYGLGWSVSREYDIAKATVEVMYGVLKDFPDLKFLMPHYGGGIQGQKGRLRGQFSPDSWKWDVPGKVPFRPNTPREVEEKGLAKAFDQIFDKVYFDMAGGGVGWLPNIEAAIPNIRADRLCFGTDYPYDVKIAGDVRYFIDVVKKLDIPEANRRLILGENIKRLFKI